MLTILGMKTGTGLGNNRNDPPARHNSCAATGREGDRTMSDIPTCYTTGQQVRSCPCERCTRKVAKYIAFNIRPCQTCHRVYDRRNGTKGRFDQCDAEMSTRLTKRANIRDAQNKWAIRQQG